MKKYLIIMWGAFKTVMGNFADGVHSLRWVIVAGFMAVMIIIGAKAGHEYVEANTVVYEYKVQILDTAGNIIRSYDTRAEYMSDEKEGIKFYNTGGDIVLYISKSVTHNIVVKREGVVK